MLSNFYCDTCTEKVDRLVQCERCEMSPSSGCERLAPEVIDFIGKYSEFCVHWFCKICDKLAIHAVQTYSHMSNPLIKEMASYLNDTLVKPLNTSGRKCY